MAKTVKITLVRSMIGRPEKQRQIAKGLGLRKTQSAVERVATPEILGMIKKIEHLLHVEEAC